MVNTGSLYYPRFAYQDVGVIGVEEKWKRMSIDYIPQYQIKNSNKSLGTSIQRYKQPQHKFGQANIQPLVFELDDETKGKTALAECRELIHYFSLDWELHDEYIRTYFSGNRGFHLIIPEDLLGIAPHPSLHKLHQRIAEGIKESLKLTCLDFSLYQTRHLLRLPNTMHPTSNLFKIELYPQELPEGMDYIRKLAREPRAPLLHSDELMLHKPAAEKYMSYWVEEFGTTLSSVHFNYPCVETIYQVGYKPGNRHNCSFAIAIGLKEKGIPEYRTLEILLDYNRKFFDRSHEVDFAKIEANVKSQVSAIYRFPYRIGCKEGHLSDLLKQYCSPFACPMHKPHRGGIYIEHNIEISPIWNEKRGLRRTRKTVYMAMRSWEQINSKANNPVHEGKKAFYISQQKLSEISGVSRPTVVIALEELIYVGLIQRVHESELPPALRKWYGRRVSDYYVMPDVTEELLKQVYEKTKLMRTKIKKPMSVRRFREVMKLPNRSR